MIPNLKLSTYNPNFDNALVRKKTKAVLTWCDEMRLSKRARTIRHTEIRKVFGNPNQEGLSQWLVANLLIRNGFYIPGKRSFSYRLNADGYKKVYGKLNEFIPSEIEVAQRRYGALVNGDEDPAYTEKDSRRYHPIQNLRRDIRKQLYAGWWDYDIEACAPTLVYQYAVRQYRFVRNDDGIPFPFPSVAKYVQEKTAVRAYITSLTGLGEQETKELVQAMFFEARYSPNPKAGIFKKLNCNRPLYDRFVKDPFVAAFRKDVKDMWRWARQRDVYERGQKIWEGKMPSPADPKASKHRIAIYTNLERQVIDAMLDHLNFSSDKKLRVHLMHDGFMSDGRLDVNLLVEAVAVKTGYAVKVKEVQVGLLPDISDEDPDPEEIFDNDAEDNEDKSAD